MLNCFKKKTARAAWGKRFVSVITCVGCFFYKCLKIHMFSELIYDVTCDDVFERSGSVLMFLCAYMCLYLLHMCLHVLYALYTITGVYVVLQISSVFLCFYMIIVFLSFVLQIIYVLRFVSVFNILMCRYIFLHIYIYICVYVCLYAFMRYDKFAYVFIYL